MTSVDQPAGTPPSQSASWKRWLWLAVRIAFVVGIFTLIFRTTDINFSDLWREASEIRWLWVLLSYVIWVFAIYVASARWKVLLNVVKRGVSVNPLFAFNLVGIFYAQFLPGMISGDVVKGYYLARDGEEKIKVMSSALMDRFLGIGVNGLLGLAALAVSPLVLQAFELSGNTLVLVLGAVIVGLLFAYGAVRFLERYESRFPAPLQKAFEPIRLYAHHPLALLGAATMSIFYFAVWTISLWALAAAVGLADLGFFTILLLLAVINVAQFLPISINGAGVREGAILLLLSAYNVPESQALVFALLIPITALGLAALGGILVLTDYRQLSEATANPSEA